VTPSKLDRSLRLFTDVRTGEGATALLMFANVFLLLCAYYFIKPLREGWIAVSDVSGLSKMEVKAYSSFGQSLLLIPAVWGYARLAARFSRTALITRATLFCMSNMLIFWLFQPDFFVENLPYTGILFYLWVGIFGLFIVAQFWTFAADLYTDERGRRLLPLIAIGATAGAACGSWITETLVNSSLVEPNWLLIAAMLPLAASLALIREVERRGVGAEADATAAPAAPAYEDSGRTPLQIVFSSRLLLATAGITLLLNWVNTNGENLLFRVVQEHLQAMATTNGVVEDGELLAFTRNATTAFYGDFFFWVNAAALLLQAFVASRLLKYGGFAAILLMLPVVALFSYTAMALIPVLAIIKVMKIAENATDYSINNTARNVLWLPVSRELNYKGKPTIDTLFVRIGDGIAAATVLVGVQLLALPIGSFFAINVGLVLVWFALTLVVVREHRRLCEDGSADAP
jgi:AAA family ATP:ADP antiporter